MTENKKMKVTFMPGCFDNFDGTQEELDALIKEIQEGFESGDFQERAIKVKDFDDLTDEELEEIFTEVNDLLGTDNDPRTLH